VALFLITTIRQNFRGFCKFRTLFSDLLETLEKIALIVAGGIGSRLNAAIPKQFILLGGYPVLMHTLDVFFRYDQHMRIMLVLPEHQIAAWQKLCREHDFRIRHEIRAGGETRFHSVKKNLAEIPDHCLVAVHDGVRPLVSVMTIDRCFRSALVFGNAVPCVDIPETLRKIDEKGSKQVDRTNYRLVQTPQVFESGILKKAYLQEYQADFTDDAGVVERLGHPIHLVEGNPENIKITYPKDLMVASSLLHDLN
jgi:2-C-methyl-D-erythritol 4-phosphate cytidylyltransferase